RQKCTVALIRSLHLVRVWTTKPHRTRLAFRTGRTLGALTVSARCGRQTRIAPVWVVSNRGGGSVLLGYQQKAGLDAGGPIVASSLASRASAGSRNISGSPAHGAALVPGGIFANAAISGSSLRSAIASIARSQRGVSSPGTSYCNPYSGYWGDGLSGCASGWRSNYWCADFAAWVWRQAGVGFSYGYGGSNINAWSASFYAWGLATGNWHPLSS